MCCRIPCLPSCPEQRLRNPRRSYFRTPGTALKSSEKSTLLIRHKGKYFPVEFQVVSSGREVLSEAGLPTCLEINLIKCVYTVNTDTSATGAQSIQMLTRLWKNFVMFLKVLAALKENITSKQIQMCYQYFIHQEKYLLR